MCCNIEDWLLRSQMNSNLLDCMLVSTLACLGCYLVRLVARSAIRSASGTYGLKTAVHLQHKLSSNHTIFHDIYGYCFFILSSLPVLRITSFFAQIIHEIHHKFILILVSKKKYKTKSRTNIHLSNIKV